jgi:hypothetical protein
MNNIKHLKGTLKSLLEAINGIEGLEHARLGGMTREDLRSATLDVLYDLKNYIGTLPAFQTNAQLTKLDAAFKAAGWDDRGLRWMAECGDEGESVFIVEFTNKKHTEWRIA